MSSMKEMAREYRLTAARLAAKIQEKRAAGAEEVELRPCGRFCGMSGRPNACWTATTTSPAPAVFPLWTGRPGEITDGAPLELSRAVPVGKEGARERTRFSP